MGKIVVARCIDQGACRTFKSDAQKHIMLGAMLLYLPCDAMTA